jgi:hypothetical protein
VVEEVGSGVASVAAGDEVFALTPFAETERLGGSAARETRTSFLEGASLSLSSICHVLRRVAP